MGLGVGELVVLVAIAGVLLLGLMVGFWLLRKTLSLIKRLVMLGFALGLLLLVTAAAGALVLYFNAAH